MSTIKSQDYELQDQVLADGDVLITRHVNKITGLTVVIANVESPIVKGDLVFATEAHDDDGLPHTLEHLVFMGSESYPYKGVLDLFANQCLADGTNAYTDTDHTNYTVSTAGSEGFLQILPVFLDHVLFPNLTDEAYCTEVHHINGAGEDAGVVYSEMQALENSGEHRCNLEMLRLLYPDSGYKSETGGIMKNLRESTSNTKVRDYHKQFYQAQNLCIIITGPVEAAHVFEAIKPIEDKIFVKFPNKPAYTRPWSAPVSDLDKCYDMKIEYASDTDEDGLVYIGFRGPSVKEDYHNFVALSVLLDYLDSTAISPIQREFVECEEPLCSSVTHNLIENSVSCFYLVFESVGKEYLEAVNSKLREVLGAIVNRKDPFDLERMKTIISRRIVRILSSAENSPHSVVVGPVIGHFLYGETNFAIRCQEIKILQQFSDCPEDKWIDLINRYFLGANARYAHVIGIPSPKVMESQAQEEKDRIAQQKKIHELELEKFAKKVEHANEVNTREIPPAVLSSIKMPSVDAIKFHTIERHIIEDSSLPIRIQYDHIKTNFVTICVIMDTSKVLDESERLYLPLLTELIIESAIKRNGQIINHQTVVKELFSDTVTYGSGIGIGGGAFETGAFGNLFSLSIQVEVSKYKNGVQWVKDLLFSIVLEPERIKTIAVRMSSEISQCKRSGGKMASEAMKSMIYEKNSNQFASNFVGQQSFLKDLASKTKTQPQVVSDNVRVILSKITNPSKLMVHLSLNKNNVPENLIVKPWLDFIDNKKASIDKLQLSEVKKCHESIRFKPEHKCHILGLGSIESNYLTQVVKTITDSMHPDLPAIHVLINYLTQLEGPLWRQIRGLGLSYSYSMLISPSVGLLYLVLARSCTLVEAYKKAKAIVDDFVNGNEPYDDNLLQSAKSSLVFEFIKREKSPISKSVQSLLFYLRNLSTDYNRDMIHKISAVTKEDLVRVGPKYMKQLFEDPEKRVIICCNSSKQEEVSKQFSELGIVASPIKVDDKLFFRD